MNSIMYVSWYSMASLPEFLLGPAAEGGIDHIALLPPNICNLAKVNQLKSLAAISVCYQAQSVNHGWTSKCAGARSGLLCE